MNTSLIFIVIGIVVFIILLKKYHKEKQENARWKSLTDEEQTKEVYNSISEDTRLQFNRQYWKNNPSLLTYESLESEAESEIKNAKKGELAFNLALALSEKDNDAHIIKKTPYHIVKYNLEKSFYWTKKAAAEANHVEAMLVLGEKYLLGLGITKDLDKAKYWIWKSEELGNKLAPQLRKKYGIRKKKRQQQVEQLLSRNIRNMIIDKEYAKKITETVTMLDKIDNAKDNILRNPAVFKLKETFKSLKWLDTEDEQEFDKYILHGGGSQKIIEMMQDLDDMQKMVNVYNSYVEFKEKKKN